MKPVLEHRTYDIFSTQLLEVLMIHCLHTHHDYILHLKSKDGTAMNRTPHGDLSGPYVLSSREAVAYAKR